MSAGPTIPRPLPEHEGDLAPFLAAAREHRLVVQRCDGCGMLRFPPRELCSGCLSTAASWREVSGRGEIFSFNVMHQVYHPAFAREVPYAVVVIKLAEGPKITSNLVNYPVDRIRIGMPVEVVFEDVSADVTLPKFRGRA
ncbi:MAG: Zn-ribbon domain-containing OB-fold protein [Deltaproteobacteria bacterium]|nr:Zn-ribbon domain-containing OB-fold protein [Deltaproteobacteria bacterium]